MAAPFAPCTVFVASATGKICPTARAPPVAAVIFSSSRRVGSKGSSDIIQSPSTFKTFRERSTARGGSVRGEAAIHWQGHAGHEAGPRAAKPEGGRGDLIR